MFVTTYRRGVPGDAILRACEQIMREVRADSGAGLPGCNGEDDHAHPLVHHPPAVALPRLAGSLKGVSSRHLRHEFTGQAGPATTHQRF